MKIVIDGNKIREREELFAALQEQLGRENFAGKNLDAFYDALTCSRERVSLDLLNYDMLREHLGGYAGRFLRVYEDYLEDS